MTTMQDIIQAIESSLTDGEVPPDIPDDIQIYRAFLASVGCTPKEYLRRRRLSTALSRLRTSDMPDVQVAYSCGYSSQQAMCREIKSRLGMTAGEYRRSEYLYYFPPYNAGCRSYLTVSRQSIPALIELHYISASFVKLESRAAAAFLNQNPTYSGHLFGRDGGQSGSRFRYTLYAEPLDGLNTDEFIVGSTLPGYDAVMAVVSAHNDEREISDTWDWLYTHWLPYSSYRYAGEENPASVTENTYFEEYLFRAGQPYRLKLYLPVVRREELWKLRLKEADFTFLTCTAVGADAEAKASRTLVESMREENPHLLSQADRFMISESGISCTCGVICGDDVEVRASLRKTKFRGMCIHTELTGLCSRDRIREMLAGWAAENGYKPDPRQPPFFLYHEKVSVTEVFYPVAKFAGK